MNKLLALYEAHQGKVSDKWWSYLQFYDDLFSSFSKQPVRILEIGIQNGGSLEIWAKYFPNAEVIVGCDINPLCSKLSYEDPRIKVIVGDANKENTFSQIVGASNGFDIVIDDGSHRSDDIIRSFAKYFPIVSEGGLFIAEDLHCSYWDRYQGGIEAPYSSINFFKRLSDYVNREHWGGDVGAEEILSFFAEFYEVSFDATSLEQITELRFRNSVVAVFKGSTSDNSLGKRVVVGNFANVEKATARVGGTYIKSPNQGSNEYGPLSLRIEETVYSRKYRERSAADRQAVEEVSRCYQKSLERTERALIRARTTPLEPLGQWISFHLLNCLAKIYLPFSKIGEQWISRKVAKVNPNRLYSNTRQAQNQEKQ